MSDLLARLIEAGTPANLVAEVALELARGDKNPQQTEDRQPRLGTSWKRRAFDRIVARDGLQCADCSIEHRTIWRKGGVNSGDGYNVWRHQIVHPSSNLELDHRVPLSEGGDNGDANLWLLCVDCHKAKTSSERSMRLKRLFSEARA